MGQPRDRRGRLGRTRGQESVSVSLPPATDQFGLLASDLSRWMDEFGADEEQIRHDYAISHALAAISAHSSHPVAAAMIDRLVHHAEVLTLAGESYRTRARRELLKTTTTSTK